jgi:CRP-like cAMP-binding protein
VSGPNRALTDYVVQIPLSALRINCTVLQREMVQQEALRGAIMRYLFLRSNLLAQISACNRLHSLEQRCCHWLLVAHDGALADEFPLTHEVFVSLLGVQRPSISTAANALQARGLIHYHYGHITIVDRAALEEAACECYRTLRGQIDALFVPAELASKPITSGPLTP